MKNSSLFIMFFAAPYLRAQCCYNDSYTASSGWTMNGSGYTIGSGTFSFNTTPCATYNYADHPLNCTLSDNSWTGDVDFVYTARGSVGVAHVLLSATAGTLNSWNTGGTSYTATNQDAIEAFINCPAYGAQNTDSIFGHAKNGNVWNTSSIGIPLSMGTTYYIRLERLSPGQGRISLFTDPARTIQAPGSPQYFAIGCSVTGLTQIQHGCIPQGAPSRTLTGTLSNLHICDSSPTASCCYNDNYASSSGWAMNGSSYTIGAGNFSFNATPCAAYNYATHPLNCFLSDDAWKGDVDFVYTSRGSVGVAHTLLSATAGTQNSWNTGGTPYTSTTQDAIEAYINCPAYGSQSTDSVFGRSKDGNVWNAQSVGIPLSMGSTYYIRVERLSLTQGKISLYTNAARTIQAPGSPQYFSVGCTVTGLNTVQQGCIPQGAPSRSLTGTLANLKVCNSVLTGVNETIDDTGEINVFPNPNSGDFNIVFPDQGVQINSVLITDVLGKIVYRRDKVNDPQIRVNLSGNSKGIYFITFIHNDLSKSVKRIIVQ